MAQSGDDLAHESLPPAVRVAIETRYVTVGIVGLSCWSVLARRRNRI